MAAHRDNFVAFVRSVATDGKPSRSDRKFLHRLAQRIEQGATVQPASLARLAVLAGQPLAEILARAPTPAIPSDSRAKQPYPDARAVLNKGLARSGVSLRETCQKAGLVPHTVQGWLTGTALPYRGDLQRLAGAAGAPELVQLIPSRPGPWIRMRCRSCGAEKQLRPGDARQLAKLSSATVDWDHLEGEHLCIDCNAIALGVASKQSAANLKKRKGTEALRARGRYLGTTWPARHPEQAKQARDRAVQSSLAARHARPHSDWTPVELARERLGRLSLNPAGRFVLCPLCGQLNFIGEGAKGSPMGFHLPCLSEWRRNPLMTEWAKEAQWATRDGRPIPSMPLPTPGHDRQTSSTELRDQYQTTLRYFWLKLKLGRADRDDHGHLFTVRALAKDFGIEERTLRARVTRFFKVLPPPEVAAGRIRQWREIFTTLRPEVFE